MELKEGSNSTVLELTQTNVPRSDEDLMRQNWDNMYFNRIKHIFGYII
jgi:activator of HSP90 ATPase